MPFAKNLPVCWAGFCFGFVPHFVMLFKVVIAKTFGSVPVAPIPPQHYGAIYTPLLPAFRRPRRSARQPGVRYSYLFFCHLSPQSGRSALPSLSLRAFLLPPLPPCARGRSRHLPPLSISFRSLASCPFLIIFPAKVN